VAAAARFEGGCPCGAVRYALAGPPAVPGATLRRADLAWTRGRPAEHRSSPPVSALPYTSALEPDTLDVTVASLDDPESLPLEDHVWTADGLSWMQHDDGRPRHRQRRSDT